MRVFCIAPLFPVRRDGGENPTPGSQSKAKVTNATRFGVRVFL